MWFDFCGTQRIIDAIDARFAVMFQRIDQLEAHIMASNAELAQQLRDLKDQNEKARAEILAKIKALEDALANGDTTPEVDAALADLKASIQADDDMHADTP
jgi:hypothetical protein